MLDACFSRLDSSRARNASQTICSSPPRSIAVKEKFTCPACSDMRVWIYQYHFLLFPARAPHPRIRQRKSLPMLHSPGLRRRECPGGYRATQDSPIGADPAETTSVPASVNTPFCALSPDAGPRLHRTKAHASRAPEALPRCANPVAPRRRPRKPPAVVRCKARRASMEPPATGSARRDQSASVRRTRSARTIQRRERPNARGPGAPASVANQSPGTAPGSPGSTRIGRTAAARCRDKTPANRRTRCAYRAPDTGVVRCPI